MRQAGWLVSVRRLQGNIQYFWSSVAGNSTMSYLSDFACGIPLHITSAVKLAQNTDFLSLIKEMEW